jgi:hypothetical protein
LEIVSLLTTCSSLAGRLLDEFTSVRAVSAGRRVFRVAFGSPIVLDGPSATLERIMFSPNLRTGFASKSLLLRKA